MARYADEGAIADSQRAFYTLTPGDQLPFSDEAIDLVDELARDKLPEHVLERGRKEREREATERAKEREGAAWYEEQLAGLEAMSDDERKALLAEAGERLGSYDARRWQLEQRIKRLEEGPPGHRRRGR